MKKNRYEDRIRDIYKEFIIVRDSYMSNPIKGSGDRNEKGALEEYSDKFSKLYSDIIPVAAYIYSKRTEHDDKSCTAKKARICRSLTEKDPKLSWNKATDYASASEEYEEFLKERTYYYMLWENTTHLRDSIKQYSINIGSRLSNLK